MGLPSIANDLPSDFEVADTEFNDRVRSQYKTGISESLLVDQLERDGFKAATNSKSARISRDGFPCTLVWWITWKSASDGKTSDIQGHYDGVCL